MGKATDPKEIPLQSTRTGYNESVKIGDKDYNITCVYGQPALRCIYGRYHNPTSKGRSDFEFDKLFPERVNTEFVRS